MKRYLVFGLVAAVLALNLLSARGCITPIRRVERRGRIRWKTNVDLFAAVLQKVRGEYVDATNLTYHALVYSALKGMVG